MLVQSLYTPRGQVVEWIEFKPRRGMRSTKLNRSSWSTKDLKARNEAGKGKKCGRPKGSGRTRSVCAALRTKRRRATGSGANRVVGRVDTPLPKKMHAATRPSRKEAFGMHRRPDKKILVPTPQPQHQSPESEGKQRRRGAADSRESSHAPVRRSGGKRTAPCKRRPQGSGMDRVQAQSGHEVDRTQSEQQVVE